MPYKEFQINEILTASDVNTYLMKQSVMTFADSTARAAALGTPTAGMLSFLADSTAVQVYSGSTAVGWTSITGGGGGGVTVGTAAPSTPSEGDLWWDSDDGKLYVYYDDGTSQQWVDAAGPSVAVQSTAPTGYQGQLWLDSDDGSMYVYYTDPGGTASSWIGAVSRSGGILQVVQTMKTDVFSTSSTTFTNVTGLSATITPRSTTSKILVLANVAGSSPGTDGATAFFALSGGNTASYIGDVSGSRRRSVYAMYTVYGENSNLMSFALNYLDSPNTTNSVTYTVQAAASSGSAWVNRTGVATDSAVAASGASTITLIEVAG